MHVIYRITYLPHLENNTFPFYYIGSKCNYNPERNYLGSLSSVQRTWYSEGMEAGKWWAKQKKEHPENFLFEILEECDDSLSAKDMTILERTYHDALDVLTDPYFNFSKATRGFCGCKRSPESRALISEKIKTTWEENDKRREDLRERNSLTKSKELREKWKDPEFVKKMNLRIPTTHTQEVRNILSRNMKARHELKVNRKVSVDGILYDDAKAASLKFGIDAVNIRRRCRMDRYTNWNYA